MRSLSEPLRLRVPMIEVVMSLADIVDLISPKVHDHHKRVAYITLCLAEKLGFTDQQREEAAIAGALHDIGALSSRERLDLLDFEATAAQQHAIMGGRLLGFFAPLARIADIIAYHHVPWANGKGGRVGSTEVPEASHLIHIADRVAVLIDSGTQPLEQALRIRQQLLSRGKLSFVPAHMDAVFALMAEEWFWLDLLSPELGLMLPQALKNKTVLDSVEGIMKLAKVFSHIIDFRCHFTATHSSGVAASVEALALCSDMPAETARMMGVAGYFHDIGKLAVPAEIIDKPGKLTRDEYETIMKHPLYSYRALMPISDLKEINAWSSFHHERPDGKGYPFVLDRESLPPGAELMAVADVFTALAEDRPYRKGMGPESTSKVMRGMEARGALDTKAVEALLDNFGKLNEVRMGAQSEAAAQYQRFCAKGQGGAAG